MRKLKEIKQKCDVYIHKIAVEAAAIAGGGAIVPNPGAPFLVIPALMALETKLCVEIASEFEENINEAVAKGIAGSCGCTVIGLGLALGICGLLPGIGPLIDAGVAFGVVESFGHRVYKKYKNKYFGKFYFAHTT